MIAYRHEVDSALPVILRSRTGCGYPERKQDDQNVDCLAGNFAMDEREDGLFGWLASCV